MVSIVQKTWLAQNLPDSDIRPLSEFIDTNESLTLVAANGTEVNVEGVVVLMFKLISSDSYIEVPFLVTQQPIGNPIIIGFNVIQHLIKTENPTTQSWIQTLKTAIPSLNVSKIDTFVNLIHESNLKPVKQSNVKISKNQVIPAYSIAHVKCKAKFGNIANTSSKTTVIFEPDFQSINELEFSETILPIKKGQFSYVKLPMKNNTSQDIKLFRNTIVGNLNGISAIIPLDSDNHLADSNKEPSSIETEKVECKVNAVSADSQWLPPVDLSHLNVEQQEQAKYLLKSNGDLFSKDSSDIGIME